MKTFAVTVYVRADDTAGAVLAAGDILLDTRPGNKSPSDGARYAVEILGALGYSVIQVCEMTTP